jgi:hypothetical protein
VKLSIHVFIAVIKSLPFFERFFSSIHDKTVLYISTSSVKGKTPTHSSEKILRANLFSTLSHIKLFIRFFTHSSLEILFSKPTKSVEFILFETSTTKL